MKRLMLISLLLCGCASLSTELPSLDEARIQSDQIELERTAFAKRSEYLDRCMRVGSRVLAANADICEKTRPDIGVITHRLKDYSKALRPAAARGRGRGW